MTEFILVIFAIIIFINLFSFIFSILIDEIAYRKIRKIKGKRYDKQKR